MNSLFFKLGLKVYKQLEASSGFSDSYNYSIDIIST